jgi:hypothetical protein
MKAEIRERGELIIIAQNSTEFYALEKWFESNINPCTLEFEKNHKSIYYDFYKPKITLFHRIKLRIQLFLYR